ncbi:MAG: peptidoglycan DD-metalloendopeptidase family protein [Gemmatimonadetes bacterium]|nr:peptidoglycan DD-metalloendopeptidase family protein [Gemmatimonadota bacterium]
MAPSSPPIGPREILERVKRRYSVMVMTGPGGGLRHFSVPGVIIPLLAGLTLLGVIGGGAAVLHWASTRTERAYLAELENENQRLGTQLEEMQDLVGRFESRMAENLEMEQAFRAIANLDAIPEDVRRLGVGGPPPLSELSDEASPSPTIRAARETLSRLEDLDRQASFQSANFEQMIETLQDSQDDLQRIPSISPVQRGWYSSGYGTRKDPFTGKNQMHRGLDFSAWTGTPVHATAAGRVIKAGKHRTLGLYVEIDHGNGIMTRYGHNSRLLVKVGQQVKRGDVIAEVGSTGRSTSPHCHYEVHVDGRHTNPWRYILDGGPQMQPGA